ncbi:GNAT family N-acetyltransferase [Yinghuangia seranimata]|uniref:GNAT family N-acetyltransferase n=1 Tax=Yinghuangia seranimata TaxID=408067 RepID=UPI00248C8F0C|nr:GNAT family N-acetyltransferase [Yinghuangia seranimata]MDI2131082.1 GNAT family N-acetyltransferase [Yinghuangia seranimata]
MSDLTVRELHALDDLEAVYALFHTIWRSEPGSAPITAEQMRALSHAGNYVAGAYSGDRLVGATVGFFAAPVGQAMHSHVTGALPGYAAGFALKQHQRDWALERGLTRVTWTFDPLIRRNAHFNLAKLGARPAEYLPRFYGHMHDAINGGDETDRVLVSWELASPEAVAAAALAPLPARVPDGAAIALYDRDGRPVTGRTDAATLLVGLPPDIESLRRTDPAAARSWRAALRDVLGGLMADGAAVTGFDRRAGYIVTRSSA